MAQETSKHPSSEDRYVGTIVGESSSREFRLAVAHEMLREQDIIAVDVELRQPTPERLRIWAKVQRIERINPLFPSEAGHELAATHTNPFDTVLSLSREMVTAVCQVLGSEPQDRRASGKLDHLRYPAQPATSAYMPDSGDIARVVLGDLAQKQSRALDIARLSNRPDVDVLVDGHAVVSRHLAILAMTGAGKSVTSRRIIEQLAEKNYPIVIFDPHGDYTGLADVEALKGRVDRFYATFPVFEEDVETVARIVDTLGYELTPNMRGMFDDLFQAGRSFSNGDDKELQERAAWLSEITGDERIQEFGLSPNMWLLAQIANAGETILGTQNQEHIKKLSEYGWSSFERYKGSDRKTLEAVKKRVRTAAKALYNMEMTSQKSAGSASPLPTDRTTLVKYGRISVVALAGYTSDFQATLYTLIAGGIFEKRVSDELKLPVLLVLEEAHNFAPGQARTVAEERAILTTKQIAQEGRKFGVGLVMISQRPSRLDETTLSQCNSFIIMRMVNPADQNFVRKVVESLGEDDAKMLPELDVGEALLSGQFINFPVLVRIKQSASQGEHEEEDAFVALQKALKANEEQMKPQEQKARTNQGRRQ